MNNKNKIGALALKCEEQKEKILELESELRRAKYNQEINDVTKNRLSMAVKYLEGQVEALRDKSERDTEAKRGHTEGKGCEWCERDEDGQLRLIWECGLDHFDFDLNACPNCGRKLKEDWQMEKLKSCPFCRGEAMIEVIEPHTHTLATFMPDCEGKAFVECQCGAAISGETRDAALAAWNRRAEQNPKSLTLDELREIGGELVWVESDECGMWYRTGEAGSSDIRSLDGRLTTLEDTDYGKTWLAYRTKQEGSGKE